MSILEDLWYENINPTDMVAPFERTHLRLYDLCEKSRAALKSTLDDKQKETLNRINELCTQIQLEGQRDAFSVGFRLGVQLMAAALCDFPE